MKSTFYTAALAAMTASLGSAMSVPRAGNYPIEGSLDTPHAIEHIHKRASKDLGLPDDTLKTNCISVGFLPSEGDSASPRYTMAQINDKLGAKASTYGWYAQIKSSSFDGSQLLAVKEDVVASGMILTGGRNHHISY